MMSFPYELFIGLRYLKSKRKNSFISLITIISVGGVAVGVATLLVVLAVMNGFDRDLREKIVGFNPHIIIQGTLSGGEYRIISSKIKRLPQIRALAPVVGGVGLIKSNWGTTGVGILGIDPDESDVTEIRKSLKAGKWEDLESGLVVGKDLAKNNLLALGDKVTIMTPALVPTALGPMPRMQTLPVIGIFETKMYEYDSNWIYISLSRAQQLFNLEDNLTGIQIRLNNIYQAPRIGEEIRRLLSSAELNNRLGVRTWMDVNRNFFLALKTEKIVMFIILSLIILVAAFNIASTLIMMVVEKTKDIGILKSIGATRQSIMRIFMLEGLVIGIIGSLAGCIAGLTICQVLDRYPVPIPGGGEIYQIETLPVKMEKWDMAMVSLAALTITFLSTLYPARQAARLNPVEAIRYE